MKKRRAPRVVFVALAVLAEVGVSRAADLVEARPGAAVRVTTAQEPAGRTILGTLVELDRDTVIVVGRSERDRIRIPRTTITRLEVRKGRTRGDHALIGAGVGIVIGLGLAAIAHSRCEGEYLCGVEYAAYPILGAPAGALIGLAVPGNRRWVEVSPAAMAARPTHPGLRVVWSVRF